MYNYSYLAKLSLIAFLCYHPSCIPAPPPPEEMTSASDAQVDAPDQQEPERSITTCERSEAQERTWSGVIYELRFGREEPSGVSLGDDIDGHVTSSSDPEGCFRPDLTSPDGVPGIDNQFARILPLVEAVGGEAIEGLVQGIINQGRLLLMMELSGLDSLVDDDCVHFDFFYGKGVPEISNQGFIVSGQTFDRDQEKPSVKIENVGLQSGVIEVEGLSMTLPLQVFDQSYILEIGRGTFFGEFTQDGELIGYLSGAIDVEAVARRVEMIEGGGQVAALVPGFLRQQADLSPDDEGVCQELSITLTFKAKPAYLFVSPEK